MDNKRLNDFEFFSFFTGLQQKELIAINMLINSFPYKISHRINVIDSSKLTYEKILNKEDFFVNERTILKNPKYDINLDEINQFFNLNTNYINRVIDSGKTFHGDKINYASKTCKTRYMIIMDSDIIFKNNNYLYDIIGYLNVEKDTLAIGEIMQKVIFHFSLDTILEDNWILRKIYKHISKKTTHGRFPQFNPILLCIDNYAFKKYNMQFKNMYLDVYNLKDNRHHKLFGDNGSSFLFYCALTSGKTINIDLNKYIKHKSATSNFGERITK